MLEGTNMWMNTFIHILDKGFEMITLCSPLPVPRFTCLFRLEDTVRKGGDNSGRHVYTTTFYRYALGVFKKIITMSL